MWLGTTTLFRPPFNIRYCFAEKKLKLQNIMFDLKTNFFWPLNEKLNRKNNINNSELWEYGGQWNLYTIVMLLWTVFLLFLMRFYVWGRISGRTFWTSLWFLWAYSFGLWPKNYFRASLGIGRTRLRPCLCSSLNLTLSSKSMDFSGIYTLMSFYFQQSF